MVELGANFDDLATIGARIVGGVIRVAEPSSEAFLG
jgi:hypothetical protein